MHCATHRLFEHVSARLLLPAIAIYLCGTVTGGPVLTIVLSIIVKIVDIVGSVTLLTIERTWLMLFRINCARPDRKDKLFFLGIAKSKEALKPSTSLRNVQEMVRDAL